jgi:paraquat-inducible protein B
MVYKTFSKKTTKLLGKHVEFTPHPRSLDGANAPNAAELTRLGFSDVNTALENTIEALENIPAKENPHKDIMREIVGIKEEISTMKEELRSEQHQIAEKAAEKSTLTLNTQMTLLKRQLATTMQALDMTRACSSAIESNMDTTN